jgi:hypothetical protein
MEHNCEILSSLEDTPSWLLLKSLVEGSALVTAQFDLMPVYQSAESFAMMQQPIGSGWQIGLSRGVRHVIDDACIGRRDRCMTYLCHSFHFIILQPKAGLHKNTQMLIEASKVFEVKKLLKN